MDTLGIRPLAAAGSQPSWTLRHCHSECLWGTSPEELKLMVSEIDECAGLPFPIEWKAKLVKASQGPQVWSSNVSLLSKVLCRPCSALQEWHILCTYQGILMSFDVYPCWCTWCTWPSAYYYYIYILFLLSSSSTARLDKDVVCFFHAPASEARNGNGEIDFEDWAAKICSDISNLGGNHALQLDLVFDTSLYVFIEGWQGGSRSRLLKHHLYQHHHFEHMKLHDVSQHNAFQGKTHIYCIWVECMWAPLIVNCWLTEMLDCNRETYLDLHDGKRKSRWCWLDLQHRAMVLCLSVIPILGVCASDV